jgi:uncharacterized protein (UPF0332 family)
MAETELEETFLAKAAESLEGALSEFSNRRFNNCANRCYYACFQGAVAALIREGIRPAGTEWRHAFVRSQFSGRLIYRRKRYPASLGKALEQLRELRRVGDYSRNAVSPRAANRAIRHATEFLEAIRSGGNVR